MDVAGAHDANSHDNRPDSEPARKKRRVACSACRQSKLRCNPEQTPCARCRRLSLPCEREPKYKRVNPGDKILELENHITQLRVLVNNRANSNTAAGTPAGSIAPLSADDSSPEQGSYSDLAGSSPAKLLGTTHGSGRSCDNSLQRTVDNLSEKPDSLSISNVHAPNAGHLTTLSAFKTPSTIPRTIGSLELDSARILALFHNFFTWYHPPLPFLEPGRVPDRFYDGSPLLFWTIIAIALRHYRDDASLAGKLKPLLNNLLWTTIQAPPINLPGVQALLLLCCWPVSDFTFWAEKSITLINIARTASLNIGLHRPGREDEFPRVKFTTRQFDLRERSRTWSACAILCQCLAADAGHLPSLSLNDWTINRACESGTELGLPLELRHNLIIQRCSNRAFQAMLQNADDPLGLPDEWQRQPILVSLDKDFDAVAEQLHERLSWINKFRLGAARLSLRCIYFLDSVNGSSRVTGILSAYSTASTLISQLIDDDDTYERLASAPMNTSRVLILTALVLWKVIFSTYGVHVDTTLGKVLFNTAVFALRQMSIEDNDMPTRVAANLKETWRMAEKDPKLCQAQPKLCVQSRLGASVVYDVLYYAREKRETQVAAATSMRPSTNTHGSQLDSETALNEHVQQALDSQQGANASFEQQVYGATAAANVDLELQSWIDVNWSWDRDFLDPFYIQPHVDDSQ